ncbi:MAG: metal-dependent hydrolase [Pseudomonadota bacterium]
MDSLSQLALGASVGYAVAGRQHGARAAVVGGLMGTLPDLDVLVRYQDPVAQMTYHRSWSHSLFWLTLAAPLCWWLAKRWPTLRDAGMPLLLAIWLALVTHPLLDAFTVYGTQLWQPFSDHPVSIGSVFIIDPVVWLLLASALWPVVRSAPVEQGRQRASILLGGLALYLALSVTLQSTQEQRLMASLPTTLAAESTGKALPTPFNTLRFRLLARDQATLCEQFVFIWQAPRDDAWHCRALGVDLLRALASHWPVQRLYWFSHGWVVTDRVEDEVIIRDVRMGIPTDYLFSFVVATVIATTVVPTETRQLPPSRRALSNWRRAYAIDDGDMTQDHPLQ